MGIPIVLRRTRKCDYIVSTYTSLTTVVVSDEHATIACAVRYGREHKLSERFDIGYKYKTTSSHLNGFLDGSNIGSTV